MKRVPLLDPAVCRKGLFPVKVLFLLEDGNHIGQRREGASEQGDSTSGFAIVQL
jgi:hypothetical protein